ncbi:MAG: hypothetical protein P8013_02805 [Candidatus Sulfobium sp.]|jgi:hypothetical protein
MLRKSLYIVFFVAVLTYGGVAWSQNVVMNGDFEAGSANWAEWNSPQAWVNGTFGHDYGSGCDVWPPVPYPASGTHSHCQHVGANNVHGGLYQVVNVIPGTTYVVSGLWSGGIGGLVKGSTTTAAWFEITVYDGVATVAQIDSAPGPSDVTIAKKEWSGTNPYSFGWETFSATFIPQSNQVTLALKTGKIGDWDAIAAYHDNIRIEALAPPTPVPTMTEWGLVIFMLIAACGAIYYLRKRKQA